VLTKEYFEVQKTRVPRLSYGRDNVVGAVDQSPSGQCKGLSIVQTSKGNTLCVEENPVANTTVRSIERKREVCV
jgi:hypothetical protein